MNVDKVKQLAVRAGLSYIDAVLGLLLGLSLTSADVSTVKTILIAALPAAITVLRNGLAVLGVPLPNTLPGPTPAPIMPASASIVTTPANPPPTTGAPGA